MSDIKEKKGANIPLILVTILFVVILIVPITMKILDANPDFKVTKEKITREDVEKFKIKVDEMVAKHTVRMEGKTPIVHPPVGSDVYLLSRNYDWGKFILELEKDKKYRLNLASEDMKHAIIVRELKLMNRIKVGEFKVIEFAPIKAGRFKLICGQYCGPGHDKMVTDIIVTE
ncbi:MAG: hypothetical protein R8K22_01765 [Mariprofundaceae bacterium]